MQHKDRLKRILIFVFATLLCTLPAPAQTAAPATPPLAAQPAPSGLSKQPVTIVPAAQDREIAERLQGILDSTGWFIAPQVSVRQGVVFLDGRTSSQEHMNWAGALAENTQGSVAVVNRIAVDADLRSTFGRAGTEAAGLYRQVLQAWPLLALAVVIAFATWLIAKIVASVARRAFSHRIASPLLQTLAVRAVSIPVILLGVYFVLQVAGLTRLAITVLGGTGLIGIVIGFAFRDIAENFLASLLLSMRNPFSKGDLIEVGGETGIVQNLNTRSTVLLTPEGNHVQIPNATVFKSIIKNYSTNSNRRTEYTVQIGYDVPLAKAQALIAGVLKEHPAVLREPEPLVLVEVLGPDKITLRVSYWFDSTSYSPAKINSALLRLTKNVLFDHAADGGGVIPSHRLKEPVVQNAPKATLFGPPQTVPAHPHEEHSTATKSEGNLSSETVTMEKTGSTSQVVEAEENLLKA